MSIKISQLPAGTAPVGTEIAPFVQGGQTVSLTAAQVAALAQGGFAAVDSGAANAYVLTTPKPLQSLTPGQIISFIPAHPSTAASTINFNGAGAVAVVDSLGNALTGGEITGPTVVCWTGSVWELMWAMPLYNKRSAAEISFGVTINPIYPPGNVKRYGAKGDGVTDDTAAIQTAINVLNNWTVYSSSIGNKSAPGPDYSQGGEVYFPGGIYQISSPILVAPNITLRGATPIRNNGTNYTGTGQVITVLRATGGFPTTGYMIDNGIWRLKNESTGTPITPARAVLAADIFYRGNDTDNGYCNFMLGMTVQDMQLDGNSVAFGGLRFQGAAFFHVEGVGVINTQYAGFSFYACFEASIGRVLAIAPIALNICACESFMQDGGECQIYSVASSAWVVGNQTTINNAFYPFADPIGSWYNLTLKVILLQWSINVTLGYLSANSGNIGLEAYHSNVNILHWENEFTAGGVLVLLRVAQARIDGLSTKSTSPLSTGDSISKLIIREPALIQCNTSFTSLNGETSSTFEVQLYNVKQSDPILGTTTNFSVVNVTKIFPYEGGIVNLFVRPGGSSTLDGLLASAPCTIDAALTFIEHNRHINDWNISMTSGDTNSIGVAHTLNDVRITWGTGSGSATITASQVLECLGVKFFFGFCAINSWTQNALFELQGVNEIEFGPSCVVTIPASKTIFRTSFTNNRVSRIQTGGLSPTINFNTGSGMCNGNSSYMNYEDNFTFETITGTATLEAISTGLVKKVASTVF
jgi:Pectate lyase superfamily protein